MQFPAARARSLDLRGNLTSRGHQYIFNSQPRGHSLCRRFALGPLRDPPQFNRIHSLRGQSGVAKQCGHGGVHNSLRLFFYFARVLRVHGKFLVHRRRFAWRAQRWNLHTDHFHASSLFIKSNLNAFTQRGGQRRATGTENFIKRASGKILTHIPPRHFAQNNFAHFVTHSAHLGVAGKIQPR